VVAFAASPEVYALAVLTALLWGFEPILAKRGMAAGGTTLQASLVVVVVDAGLYWLVLLATEGLGGLARLTPFAVGLFLLAGFVGTALGRLAIFAGVRRLGASINSAVISARPVFAAVFAVTLLGEAATAATVAGIVVLAVGLATLALARGGDVGGWDRGDLLFPLTAALVFAAGNVLRRFGLTVTPATALEAVALNETAALVALGGVALVRGPRDLRSLPRRSYGYFAAGGVLTAVALLSLFTALSLPAGRVVVVDPLVAAAPLFTAGFAYVLLDDVERVTRGVVAGAVLVVAGGVLVTVA
jgi:uncharacterized membrane protein